MSTQTIYIAITSISAISANFREDMTMLLLFTTWREVIGMFVTMKFLSACALTENGEK